MQNNMNKLLSVFGALIISSASLAQITVTNVQTPNQLVQNVLMGFGVTASNITYNGSAALGNAVQGNVSYFNAAGTNFPITSGVLLTTGQGIGAVGPNDATSQTDAGTPSVSTDPHLNDIAAGSVTNGVVLEFDFVPAGDTISFKYIFGSEEYPEFSPSSFNDAFGFFLWGPGVSGPYALGGYPAGGANLAVIPGTSTPVTINNVGDANNTQYYVFNDNGSTYGTAIQYDGTTVLLTANASVQCGETYHIKLAISNVSDQAYDSGVFLEANSFSSEAVQIAVATVTGDTTVYEGCSDANFLFIRPETQLADTMVINYTIGGTAIEGTDFNDLPTPITFLPGEDTIVINLTPTLDGISDNGEYVTLTATTISECGDTIVSQGTLYIMDSIPFNIVETDPIVQCADDSVLVTATATALFGPCTITWPDGSTGSTAYLPTVQGVLTGSVDYVITASNTCGYSATDTVTITLNQTLAVDTLLSFPADCNPIGAVSAVISGATGVPNYNWIGPGPNSPNSWDASVWQNLSSGWYYFTVTDNVCEASDSVFVDILPPPVAQFQANPNDGCSPLVVLLTNSSQNASAYAWDFGNGSSVTVNNMDPQTQTYTQNSVIRLIASEGNCADTAYIPVTISICGCMDPLAVNYNPLANYDDGSCLYPAPTVYVPNVFTPEGDNTNDLFFLTTTNSTNIELTIVNRWGNVMYENSGPNPAWDGKVASGSYAEEGVYFVKYRVEGLPGTDGNVQFLEGHGFLQLIRH
jgi:gliding motility-associated-like protein